MSEFNEFKLSYTANQINERLSRIDSLAEKSELPTKTSDLINDSNFTTKDYLQDFAQPKGDYALKNEIPKVDLSNYALKNEIPTDYLTEIPEEYVTEVELEAKGYLTEHQSLSEYAKTADLENFATKDAIDQKADISTLPRALYINLTYDEENDMYIPDKTRDEIETAYQNGSSIYIINAASLIPLVGRTVTYDDYGGIDDINYIFYITLVGITHIYSLICSQNDYGFGLYMAVPFTVNGVAPDENGNIQLENVLPAVTTSDNDKFLCVVNGSWAASSIPIAEEETF